MTLEQWFSFFNLCQIIFFITVAYLVGYSAGKKAEKKDKRKKDESLKDWMKRNS